MTECSSENPESAVISGAGRDGSGLRRGMEVVSAGSVASDPTHDDGTVIMDGAPDVSAGSGVSLSASVISSGRSSQKKRSEEHTSELQSLRHLVCRLLL